jgi:hypothetical protein
MILKAIQDPQAFVADYGETYVRSSPLEAPEFN